MAELSANLPAADPTDAPEVVLALETARALWNRTERLESVRWIQRAAQAAESSGNDERALMLARAAADLRAAVQVASEPRGAFDEAAALSPYDDFSETTIVDSPATTLARQALQGTVQISELQRAASSTAQLADNGASAHLVETAPRHDAIRVAVLERDAAGRSLSVRMLREGEAAPAGATEALLVALRSDRRLLDE
jgi:hypothetical protein